MWAGTRGLAGRVGPPARANAESQFASTRSSGAGRHHIGGLRPGLPSLRRPALRQGLLVRRVRTVTHRFVGLADQLCCSASPGSASSPTERTVAFRNSRHRRSCGGLCPRFSRDRRRVWDDRLQRWCQRTGKLRTYWGGRGFWVGERSLSDLLEHRLHQVSVLRCFARFGRDLRQQRAVCPAGHSAAYPAANRAANRAARPVANPVARPVANRAVDRAANRAAKLGPGVAHPNAYPNCPARRWHREPARLRRRQLQRNRGGHHLARCHVSRQSQGPCRGAVGSCRTQEEAGRRLIGHCLVDMDGRAQDQQGQFNDYSHLPSRRPVWKQEQGGRGPLTTRGAAVPWLLSVIGERAIRRVALAVRGCYPPLPGPWTGPPGQIQWPADCFGSGRPAPNPRTFRG